MNSLQTMSVKQVFSSLRENFSTQELDMLERDIDQMLETCESVEELITALKETLAQHKAVSIAA